MYSDSDSPIIDIEHGRKLLRKAYNNIKDVRDKGVEARKFIENNFTWDLAVRGMYDRLTTLKGCDEVIKLDKGNIIHTGNYEKNIC